MTEGVGVCPKNPEGHVWRGWHLASGGDERNSCRFCGRPGRDNEEKGEKGEKGGFFAEATMARADLFSSLRFPGSANGIVKKS